MRIASLGSGSKGNATLIATDTTVLMVDCGFPLSALRRRAEQRSFDLASLDAVLVTHEHGDHSSGVSALANAYDLPVYLTHGTAASGRLDRCRQLLRFDADTRFEIGDIDIRAVTVPHDAREPVQYCFESGGQRIGVLTDLGSVTAHVCAAFSGCDLLLLEFNHDRDLLRVGPYPPALKRRVGGDWGHLSNGQALDLLQAMDLERLRGLVIAHISEQNNSRERIESLIRERQPALSPLLCWAEQGEGFDWLGTADTVDEPHRGLATAASLRPGLKAY